MINGRNQGLPKRTSNQGVGGMWGEWDIEDNTLVIYIGGDNGGTSAVKIFNAGMKGSKGTAYRFLCRD